MGFIMCFGKQVILTDKRKQPFCTDHNQVGSHVTVAFAYVVAKIAIENVIIWGNNIQGTMKSILVVGTAVSAHFRLYFSYG